MKRKYDVVIGFKDYKFWRLKSADRFYFENKHAKPRMYYWNKYCWEELTYMIVNDKGHRIWFME